MPSLIAKSSKMALLLKFREDGHNSWISILGLFVYWLSTFLLTEKYLNISFFEYFVAVNKDIKKINIVIEKGWLWNWHYFNKSFKCLVAINSGNEITDWDIVPVGKNNCFLSVGLKRKYFCICSLKHFSDILTIIFLRFYGSICEVKLWHIQLVLLRNWENLGQRLRQKHYCIWWIFIQILKIYIILL